MDRVGCLGSEVLGLVSSLKVVVLAVFVVLMSKVLLVLEAGTVAVLPAEAVITVVGKRGRNSSAQTSAPLSSDDPSDSR